MKDVLTTTPPWMTHLRSLRRDANDVPGATWFNLREEWEDWNFFQPEEQDPEDEPLAPFMSYGWSLPDWRGDGEDTNQMLVDAYSNVMVGERCLGDEKDGHYLLLTGGGMDLSWDLAFGYMVCGYLPPACLNLPRFLDIRPTRMNKWTLKGLTLSKRIQGVNTDAIAKVAQVLKKTGPPPSRWKARPGG